MANHTVHPSGAAMNLTPHQNHPDSWGAAPPTAQDGRWWINTSQLSPGHPPTMWMDALVIAQRPAPRDAPIQALL